MRRPRVALAPDAVALALALARRRVLEPALPGPGVFLALARPTLPGLESSSPSPDRVLEPTLPGPGVFLALARLSLKPTKTSHLSPATVLEAVNPAFCQVLESPSPLRFLASPQP